MTRIEVYVCADTVFHVDCVFCDNGMGTHLVLVSGENKTH